MKRLATGALLALGVLLAGCSSLLQAPAEIEVSLEDVAASAAPGEVLSARIRVVPTNFTGTVTITLTEPPGFTLENPTSPVAVNGPTVADVRVRVAPTVPPGRYALVFRVQPQGLDPIPVRWNVEVRAPAPPEEPQVIEVVRLPERLIIRQGEEVHFGVSFRNKTDSTLRVRAFLIPDDQERIRMTGNLIDINIPPREVRDGFGGVYAWPNATGEGTIRLVAMAYQGDTRVGREETATIPYTIQPYGLTLTASDARGTLSPEGAIRPQSQVAYSARGVSGTFILESRTPGWTLSPTYVQLEEGDGTFSLTLNPPAGISPGTYTVQVRIFKDRFERTFPVNVTLATFTVALNNASLTANPNATLEGTITPQGGYEAETYTFALEGADASRFALSPSSVNAPGPFSLTLSPTVGTGPGTYNLTLRVSAPGVVRRVPFSVTVSQSSYTAELNPTSLTAYQGQSANANLTITPQGGFSGNLALVVRLSSGSVVPWLSVTPSNVSVAPNGPQTFPLVFNVDSAAPVGAHNLVLELVGSLNRTLALRYGSPPFTSA